MKKFSLSILAVLFFAACSVSFAPQSHAATNIVPNPSFETANGSVPANWTSYQEGTNTTFTYQTSGHTGSRSAKVQITSLSSGGFSDYYFAPQAVSAGAKYDFSFWYQSNVEAEVDAEITTTSGSNTWIYVGTVPASSTWKQYTATVTMPSNAAKATVYAYIYSVGYLVTDDYNLSSQSATPTVATPNFSPAAGTYTSAQNVTISDATAGAQIRYTTDGTTPTASSTLYSSAISVTSTKTIKAIAIASGYTNSAVASATYTISAVTPTAATPVFSPVAGTYTSAQSVTISDTTAGAKIYYTTNGTTPTAASTLYTSPVSITSTKTLKAIAIATGYKNSAVKSGTYTINVTKVATPVFSPVAGTYTSAQSVTISDATSGATIYYTTNGTTPTTASTVYSGAISVTSTKTLKALAVKSGLTNSTVASATYTINIPVAATPTFSPAGGTYTSAQNVTISDTTTGAKIYYTTNGTTPTTASTLYSGVINVASTKTLKAIAIATGYTNSAVGSATYTISTIPPSGNNIIPNPSFETVSGSLPASWQHDQWGTGLTATYTYNTALGHTGTHSATLKVTQYGTEGDAKWDLITPLTVVPGDNYIYTDWYQSSTTSRIVLEYNLTDGSQYYGELRNAPASPSAWKQYSQDLVIPYNAKSMRVYHMLSGVGTLTIDDASLVKTVAPAGFTRPIVTITYDDGFEDNITTVMPLLDEFGYKVTYCFATMFAEGVPSAEATVKAIASKGHEICSHSVNHLDMTTLTAAQLDYELGHSQAYLQQLTGQPIHNYFSPFGTYNELSLQYVKKYYRALRTTDEGYNSKVNFDQYRINVQNMTNTTTMAQYKSWVDQAIKDKTWLVIVYHRVASDPTQFDTPVADFRPQLQYLTDKAVTVKTLDQALSELEPQVGINDGYTPTP